MLGKLSACRKAAAAEAQLAQGIATADVLSAVLGPVLDSIASCLTHPTLASCLGAVGNVILIGTSFADVGAEAAEDGGLALAACGGMSFTAATKVVLADGKAVPISQLKPGDKVLATNTGTGKTQAETVASVLVHYDTDLYDLKVRAGGRTAVIDTTTSHLFWDDTTSRWVKTVALGHGAHLRTPGGGIVTTVGGYAPMVTTGWMWDLTVPSDHDFYIDTTAAPVLVHNCLIDDVPAGKTVAVAGDTRTLSGWGPVPAGYNRVSPQQVLDFQNEMGFPARAAGPLDQGTPGQYFASHAERQAALLSPNTPIKVSSPMCTDCQAFFQRLAEHNGVEQQVTDPLGMKIFSP